MTEKIRLLQEHVDLFHYEERFGCSPEETVERIVRESPRKYKPENLQDEFLTALKQAFEAVSNGYYEVLPEGYIGGKVYAYDLICRACPTPIDPKWGCGRKIAACAPGLISKHMSFARERLINMGSRVGGDYPKRQILEEIKMNRGIAIPFAIPFPE